MMEPNKWTPGRGWAIALIAAARRAAIVLGIVALGLYFAWPVGNYLPTHWAVMGVLFLVCAAVGYPAGYLVARNLADDSGLAGKTVLLPVLVLAIAAHVAAYQAVFRLRGDGGMIVWMIALGLAFWCAAAVFKTLVLE